MKRILGAAVVLLGLAACGDGPTSPVKALQVTDITVGTGTEAVGGKTVTVGYTGWIYDVNAPDHKGMRFDGSSDHGGPYSFLLGIGVVIEGWDRGIVGMKVGGTRELIIPPNLAYGKSDYGPIPGNSALVFDIQLLNVQ